MKLLKRTLSACLALAIGASSAICANAETVKNSFIGGYIPDNGSYVKTLSKKEQNAIKEKEQKVKLFEKTIAAQSNLKKLGATRVSVPGTFTIYQQTEKNYCCAASTKSVINYINGSSASQDSIAKDIGVKGAGATFDNVKKYLNSKQSDCYYVIKTTPTKDSMCSAINYTITNEKDPCIMGIVDPTGTTWKKYATYGHAICVHAIYSDKKTIRVADPAYSDKDKIPAFYDVSSDTAAKVCNELLY